MTYRRHLIAAGLAVASAAAAYGLVTLQLFDPLTGEAERRTVDWRQRMARDVERDSTGVSLVLFDAATVEGWDYLMPFPRAHLADLVRTAAANGAAVIAVDVLLDRLYPSLSAADNGDERLRDAIRDADNVVLVSMTQQQGRSRTLTQPHPYFAEVAAAIGTADMPTPYETVRDVTLIVDTDSGPQPGFALAIYAVRQGLDVDSLVESVAAGGALALPGLPREYAFKPAGEPLNLPILYEGPPSRPDADQATFRAYSGGVVGPFGAALVFEPNEALQAWFGGKVVLLGSGFHDSERFRTPYYDFRYDSGDNAGEIAGWTYGVEVHANALQNMLGAKYLRPLPQWLVFALLLAVAALTAAMTFWRGAAWGVLAPVLSVGLLAPLAVWTLATGNVVLPLIGPLLAGLFAYTSAVAYVSIVEGREKRMIRGAFAKYVPPSVVDDLVADPSKLKLGGEKRALTILFSDVAGFTSMSEALPPERLVAILNEYLDEMSDIVFDERGTLDKYIGDAIMALWGAPTPVPQHALHGCRTALRMQRRLAEWNAEWRARNPEWQDLHIRIGLNTGTPVVGNIGGERRFDYTALGDAVNLAARLEPACKSYGVEIMIAQPTREQAGDAIVVRELDMLAVYGKAEPVRVYELVALAGDVLGDALRETLQHYASGLAAYRRRDFELAVSFFDAALSITAEDGPSRMYRDRSEQYMLNPPPADWDFVERRQVK